MKHLHSRRGSMQLSIEAIIILVIAMVLLGVGIAFITGSLNNAKAKIDVSINNVEVGCDPNEQDQVKIIPNEVKLATGDSKKVNVCTFFSNTQKVKEAGVSGVVCEPTIADDAKVVLIGVTPTPAGNIPTKGIGKFAFSLEGVKKYNGICTVTVQGKVGEDTEPTKITKQISVQVTA